MRSPDGQVWRFDAGTLCLEFLLTGSLPEWEQLFVPADLAAWIPLSRLGVSGEVVVSEEGLAAAKRLRAAIHRLATTAADVTTLADATTAADVGGAGPAPNVTGVTGAAGAADLVTLNELAAAPPPVPVIGPSRERGWAYPLSAARFLSAVARDAIELFGGPGRERVRMCGGERCALLFLDTSRPGARRWCSMERCGNRHKLRTRKDRN